MRLILSFDGGIPPVMSGDNLQVFVGAGLFFAPISSPFVGYGRAK